MFCVIYRFKVLKGSETLFVEAWSALTELIYKYDGSMGSRLHLETAGVYIAYAQWPDRPTWKNAGTFVPEEAEKWRMQMRSSCESIETLHELNLETDLLKTRTNTGKEN
jgi:hypothetical protein